MARIYQFSLGHSECKIRPIALDRNHLHFRTTLQLHHTRRHPWHQHTHPRPRRAPPASPGRPRRQPASRRRHQEHDATKPTPPNPRRTAVRDRPQPAPKPPGLQPVTHDHQNRQTPGLFPRVEGPQRLGHGRGIVPRSPGSRQSGVYRRPRQLERVSDEE